MDNGHQNYVIIAISQNQISDYDTDFGGIDIVINNASAISLTPTDETEMKRYDLMNNINTRGTFLVSKECLPYLKKSKHAHILNLSPPLNMSPHWFSKNLAYTIAKYGMSMCVLGMAEEFRDLNIGVNALWPRTTIHTAAVEMLVGSDSAKYSRTAEIMADAAYHIICSDPRLNTGNFYVDEDYLKLNGVTDMIQYACVPEFADQLMPDGFLDDVSPDVTEIARDQNGGLAKLFGQIEGVLTKELVKQVNAIYLFDVKGSEPGVWHVDLKNGSGSCGKGQPSTPADSTFTVDSNIFFDLFTGKVNSANAFMNGKLKISGDLSKAMKLEKLMGGLKSKL